MDLDLPHAGAAGLAAVLALSIALSVYARIAAHVARAGGRVRTGDLALPELLMAIVLGSFFTFLMISALLRQSQEGDAVDAGSIVPSSLMFLGLTVGVAGFIRYRGLSLPTVFGLKTLPPLAAAGWAVGLIGAAFPLTAAANMIMILALKDQFAPQPLVEFFSAVSREGNYPVMGKVFFAGVVIAPVCEEFLFRGFFYGVGKRYLGAVPSALLCSVLFASFHTNLAALGGLFVLALCLNLAYERTGSLLVPIGMHAIFNFSSLLLLYVQARHPLPV